MAEGWSGATRNAPVSARLFGGGFAPRPGTASSPAALAEMMRIQALYGIGAPRIADPVAGPQPMAQGSFEEQQAAALMERMRQQQLSPAPPPPNVLEQMIASTAPTTPPLMPGTQAALDAPMLAQNMPPGADPVPPMNWQQFLDSIGETRPAAASVPANADPSSAPQTPPQSPQESGRRLPHGTASALAWRDFLGGLIGGAGRMMQGVELPGMPGASGARAVNARAAGVAESPPYMAPENYPRPAGGDPTLPFPPEAPPGASPQDSANAIAGVTRGRPYARLALQDPNYDAVMEAYRASGPKQVEEAPNAATMRLVAAALGGVGPGELGPLGAISGLAAGYAREGDRDLARRERDEQERRGFQRGLAGLMGEQEQNRWQTGLARQTFDRGSQSLEDQDARAREGLAIQRENAGLTRALTAMRITTLARNAGLDLGPAELLSRGVPELVRSNAPLILQGEGGTSQLLLPIPPEYLARAGGQAPARGEMLRPDDARRRVTEHLMRQPGYAAAPQSLARAVDGVLSQAYATAILSTPEPQRTQLLNQMRRHMENRPRAGQTNLIED